VLGVAVAGDAFGLGEEGFGVGGEEDVLDRGQHGAGGQADADRPCRTDAHPLCVRGHRNMTV
jgi:hypothetical protein